MSERIISCSRKSTYVHFTEEQKQRANNVDLVDFLRTQGEEVVRASREWRWKRHDSVTISGSRWYRHSTEQGGYAIDFVREFYGLSFPDAVTMLLGGEQGAGLRQSEPKEERSPKPFALPEAHDNARRVYAYLMKQRCIDPDIITHFIKSKSLYEDAQYHNAVFVGLDENGQPRHAHKKSTYSIGQSFRANVEGSDARYGFSHIGTSDRLYVFEAPIDQISFITMHKENWKDHSYLTLNGVAEHTLIHLLNTYPHLRAPVLCLDNDKAGIDSTRRLTEKLRQTMDTDASCLLPDQKDWNEQLQAISGKEMQAHEMRMDR